MERTLLNGHILISRTGISNYSFLFLECRSLRHIRRMASILFFSFLLVDGLKANSGGENKSTTQLICRSEQQEFENVIQKGADQVILPQKCSFNPVYPWANSHNVSCMPFPVSPFSVSALLVNMNQTFAGDGSALNASKWSVESGSSCDLADPSNAFTDGNIMTFCTPDGSGTGATMVIGGITASENFTLSSTTGIITNLNNDVVNIDVAADKTLNFFAQTFGQNTAGGYVKIGDGALVFAGGSYSGGFTLNAGTIIAKGQNAMGGPNPNKGPLNLNSGIVTATGNLSFYNKYSVININGDIQFGSTIAPASSTANLYFLDSVSLGNENHTLTLDGYGTIGWYGVIANTGSDGISFSATSSGTGRFELFGTTNTFTGPVNLLGNGGSGVGELRLAGDGCLGNTGNTININGGRLATATSGTSFEILASRGIHVGNVPGTSISTITTITLTYNGVIADLAGAAPGSWAKQGPGTLSLGGVSTYTGSTSVNNGILILTAGNNRLPITTTLNLGQNNSVFLGTIDLNGYNQEIAGLNSLAGFNTSTNNNTINSTNGATLTISGNGTYSFGDGSNANSGVITGAISIVKTGTGTQTLGDANTYTGNTTISNGELRFNPSVNTSFSGSLIMNGGILGTTGIADTRTLTFSSFDLSDSSSIDLSAESVHTISFTTAGTFTAEKSLVVYGWQGTSGMSGTKGKIFFGNSAAALTSAQLAQISFNDGSIGAPGAFAPALILATGEIVPDVFVNNAPTIVMDVVSTTDYLDGGVMSSPSTPYAISGVISDPTDPFSMMGIDFTVNDAETGAASLVVTAVSGNTDVVPNANMEITGTDETRNVKVTPAGVGYADITVSVSDGVHTTDYVINYAASAASVNNSTTRFFTGTSGASTAQAIDSDYMLVGDDQNQVIRLYNRNNSGLPVNGTDFSTALGISMTNPEVDIEASVRTGDRIYWLGSHSNADADGSLRPNRYRLFATDISGSGEGAMLTYVGRYDSLRADLIAWDANNDHGLGADYFGLSTSAADGVLPEAADGSGFNIEGIAMAPDNTTAYIGFRAPISPAIDRTKALLVPLTNLADLVSGNPSAGPAMFGDPILLDLGGLGIREIRRNTSGQYLIIAGSPDESANIQLYTWTGNALDPPELRAADLSDLATGGEIESIVDVPDPLLPTSMITVLVDNGATDFYGDTMMANELSNDNHKKFRSETVTLGCGNMVFNTLDAGAGSLREVIGCAPNGAAIHFANALMDSTITLTSGQIEINKDLTITGPGQAMDMVLSGNYATRIFHVTTGNTLTLNHLSLVNASAAAPYGGALYIEGNLTLQDIILQNNFEDGFIPKSITVNSPGGLIQIIGNNVQLKQ